MASALTDRPSAPAERGTPATPWPERGAPSPAVVPELRPFDLPPEDDGVNGPLATELLADLDHPDLVLTPGYVGPERRAGGLPARIRRATFSQRRSLLSLEVVVVVAAVVVTSLVLARPGGHLANTGSGPESVTHTGVAPTAIRPAAFPAAPTQTTPTAPVADGAAPSTSAPAPSAAPAPAPAAPAPTAPPAPASAASLTPAQLGAEALTLVRYPWQQIPGYSIQFLPISDAPSSGFYGNTTFTWGHTGGSSVLYVYPGETVERLAGITAFEIAHEVDAAAVEPGGGEAQIENILNYHPPSWAPNCDCAEQNFLSGWYAAAFSNYWSPGVGNWSQLDVAPPSGATLGQFASWLNPPIP
jgi:hypothetical protein